jgi:hypothetical protein
MPSRFISVSEVPGAIVMPTTKWPSRKSGRNSPPKNGSVASAAMNKTKAAATIVLGRLLIFSSARRWNDFSLRR